MGKSKRSHKEFNREQKLVHENKKLKQQIAQLRKQLARIDLDRYDSIRDILRDHMEEDKPLTHNEILDNLKKAWACNECPTGYLEIIIFTKISSPWYYRQCNCCTNRTKSQKYDTSVKGIVKNS